MLFLSIELTEISLPLLKPNTFKLAKSETFFPHTSHKQDKDALHMELSPVAPECGTRDDSRREAMATSTEVSNIM